MLRPVLSRQEMHKAKKFSPAFWNYVGTAYSKALLATLAGSKFPFFLFSDTLHSWQFSDRRRFPHSPHSIHENCFFQERALICCSGDSGGCVLFIALIFQTRTEEDDQLPLVASIFQKFFLGHHYLSSFSKNNVAAEWGW